MHGAADERPRWQRRVRGAALVVLLLAVYAFGSLGVSVPSARPPTMRLTPQGTFTVSLSFSPNPVSAGTQTQIHLDFTNTGSTPFTVWVNGSAPGCGPQTQPFTTPNYTNSFSCTPTSSGTYNVHIDAIDSSGYKASASNTLTVNTGGGGCTSNCGGSGSGSGNGSGSGGLHPPPVPFSTLFLFSMIFLGAIIALAAGVIAMALLVSRRLPQLTEAMKPPEKALPESKPPS